MSEGNAKKKDGYHHGDLKATLVNLALQHLNAGLRPEELSVRALAAEAGVSKGAPRRHFPTADDLIAAVARQGFDMLAEALVQADDLADLGYRYVSFALRNRQLYRTMFYFPREELARFPSLAEAAGVTADMLVEAIRRHGSVRGTGTGNGNGNGNEHVAFLAAWGFVHGIADLGIQNLAGGLDASHEAFLRELTSVLVRGL